MISGPTDSNAYRWKEDETTPMQYCPSRSSCKSPPGGPCYNFLAFELASMRSAVAILILFLVLSGTGLFGGLSSGSEKSNRVWIFLKDRPYLKTRSLHPAQTTDFKGESI